MDYDVFISHASEDKDGFVRELANRLTEEHISVWYDEFTLTPGASVRKSIDKGLTKSRYGVVVFSEAFFRKEWTQWELNGLVQKLHFTKSNVLLPVWYNISYEDLFNFSPSIADIVGIIYRDDVDDVVNKIMEVVKPEGSTLIRAKEILQEYGVNPPAVTDDWWIDVIEFMGTDYYLNRWGFAGVPNQEDNTKSGRIAWAAMQMHWQEMADFYEITQISEPNVVLEFISNMPGLTEMCLARIDIFAVYAPQLTITGNGGVFEEVFHNRYIKELNSTKEPRLRKGLAGSGLTTSGLPPKCSEELSLRDSEFGEYKSSTIACHFVQGPLMGPSPKYYETFDYLIWLISTKSKWLRRDIKEFLLDGIIKWNVWLWDKYEDIDADSDIPIFIGGDLMLSMFEAKCYGDFVLEDNHINEIHDRLKLCKYYLELDESVDELYKLFTDVKLLEQWFVMRSDRAKKTGSWRE